MADQLPKAALVQDNGFNFNGGMDSYSNPQQLAVNKFAYGENLVVRGGIAQTRPGSRCVFGLPCGNLQMLAEFTPTGGNPQLVFAVDGLVYVSEAPFNFYRQLPNIQFYNLAKFVAWSVCVQSLDYDQFGTLKNLSQHKNLIVLQDGFSRAAYYDGNVSMHLNPGPSGVTDPVSGDIVVTPNTYGTPIGLWMAWSNNRLFVSNGSDLYASNIGNPLVFSEMQYLDEFNAFTMPEIVTGLVQPFQNSPLIVFGANTTTYIQSQITDRTLWATTPGMQTTSYGIGCVSHRSIVRQYAIIWWYSQGGLINLNQATQNTIDSYIDYCDDAMAVSKANLSPDKSMICGTAFEKYLLLSVPSGDTRNAHTWCLDQSNVYVNPNFYQNPGAFTDGALTWNGVWTGWRPVEWAAVTVNGATRSFFISADMDGVNRLWEGFTQDRTDNGQPITCALQTRFYDFGPAAGSDNYKDFRFTRIEAKEVLGIVDIWGGWAGTRGAFQQNLTKRIVATPTPAAGLPLTAGTPWIGYKPQVRTFQTTDLSGLEPGSQCNQCSVEDPDHPYYRDRAFCQLLIWSGRMGITGFRFFAEAGKGYDKIDGSCTPNEEGINAVNVLGCDGNSADVTASPVTTFSAAAEVDGVVCDSGTYGTGPVTGRAVATSVISQANADLRAELMAQQDAQDRIQCW